MSRHLRFGKLLGMLAIMLTLSFAWGQAQNLSSKKQLLSFGFTTAANPTAQLGTDRWGAINTTTREVTVTVPYETNLAGLKASYTADLFTNVFQGTSPFAPAVLAVSGSLPVLTWVALTPMTWTVEAENHSYENYFIKVVKSAPSTAKSVDVFSANYRKVKTCPAGNVIFAGQDVVFSGTNSTNITFKVNFGAVLDDITVYMTISPWATVVPAVASTGTAIDFDANNDGVPEAVSFVVTAQDGSARTFVVTPVISTLPSVQDNLLATGSMTVPSMGFVNGNTVVSDPTTQIITVEVPYSASTIAPTWAISEWAQMYTTNPQLGPATEVCSGDVFNLDQNKLNVDLFNFWIQAEDPSEVSLWVVKVTNAAAVTINTVTSMTATYIKTVCGVTSPALDATVTIGANTIDFAVPYGVQSVTVKTLVKGSNLSTTSTGVGTVLVNGSQITIVAESGLVRTYTVTVTPSMLLSSGKQITKFGFNKAPNDRWLFQDWTVARYEGTIDPVLKKISVLVAWNTDLHDLIASFETSAYACVTIAESNLTFTPQTSDVTINDHSNSLTYVVTAEDGTQERYEVIVNKLDALTGKDLIGFKLTGLPYCYGGTYETAGTYTGTNIAVSVKYGTNLASLAYAFTLSPGATVSGPASPANFTSPVTFTVSSQGGITQAYTVTVTTRAENTAKQLLTYMFAGADNASLGGDAVGVINEAAKTVLVKIPWDARASINSLRAKFTLSPGAQMTHSEDTPVLQVSGTSANDFSTPVAYTVWAETCGNTVEYFVTVELLPNTNTGISAFNFTYTGCATGCALVNNIDTYGRRIYITLPHNMNISNLAPSVVTVGPGAVVTVANTNPVKPWNTPQDWTKGPVTYTVTAPDATANWTVYVTNPACSDKAILSLSMPDAQVAPADLIYATIKAVPVVIDATNHTVNVIIKKGTNTKSVKTVIGLSCYATTTAPEYLNFFATGCVTVPVTAEDGSVQDWLVCVKENDQVVPLVTTWSVMAMNCTDSVAVQTNELGRVFIVNQTAINMTALPSALSLYNLADWTSAASVQFSVADLVADRLGAWAVVDSLNKLDTPIYIKTNGLYQGTYWAFSVDMYGNVSCISSQKLYLDICTVEVADLTTLRAQPDVWNFVVTGEVFVTYEESRVGGNWKFVQDAAAGILIEDQVGALVTKNSDNTTTPIVYGEGAGIKGLKGKLVLDAVQMRFVPVCCYLPTKSSTGNVVTPISLTYNEYKAQVYTTRTKYESMLVKITTPMKVINDYTFNPNWLFNTVDRYDAMDLLTKSAQGGADYFIQSIFNSPLVGKVIPTAPAYYTGVRTNVNWGSIYGLFTPRKEADITLATGDIISALPNPASIPGVRPGDCKSVTITLYNEGPGTLNITAVYLDNSAADDEFDLVTPPAVPFQIASWTTKTVTVNFCPTNIGEESTTLLVEYGMGKTLLIPINGTTPLTYEMPYLQEFKYTAGPPELWATGGDFNSYTNYTGWANPTAASAVGGVVIGYYSNFVTPYGGFVANNRSIFMRPRGGSATAPYIYPVTITTPGFKIVGLDPVVSWVETAWWALSSNAFHAPGSASDPRILSVSEDGINWTVLRNVRADAMSYETDAVASYTNPTWDQVNVSLKNYVGKTVFFKFDLGLTTGKYVYWIIDQFAVKERVTTPLIAVTPGNNDFGGVQLGSEASATFTVTNTGLSFINVKKVELVGGPDFTLTDTNIYPFEVKGGSGFAYPVTDATSMTFIATFKPTDVGVQDAKIIVTYGLYDTQTIEIPLTGKGLSCLTAAVANIGENLAPTEGVWYKYTAEKFQITQITSCDPRNVLVPFAYSWDTYLELYKDCNGTFWSGGTVGVSGVDFNDDMEAACPTNRANSSLTVVLNAGETVYIFWKLAFPGTANVTDPFYFHINPNYPIDGDVCETAIPLTLPVVNHFGTTVGFSDDYNSSPCSPFSNYMDGNDKVYSITLAEEGYLTGNILGAYGSIHVLDMCPKTDLEKFHCKAYIGGPNGGQFRKKIAAGTYFVIISTWAPPQTVDYLLNMSWESGSAVDNADLTNALNVYPNPTNGKFTVSISNSEATDMVLELVNISGQVVYRNEVKAAYSYNEDIDASTFAKGVYYLKVNSAKGVKVEKVVVQ